MDENPMRVKVVSALLIMIVAVLFVAFVEVDSTLDDLNYYNNRPAQQDLYDMGEANFTNYQGVVVTEPFIPYSKRSAGFHAETTKFVACEWKGKTWSIEIEPGMVVVFKPILGQLFAVIQHFDPNGSEAGRLEFYKMPLKAGASPFFVF